MRILLVHPGPEQSVQDVFAGVRDGLRAQGCEVGCVNLNDRIAFYTAAHLEREGEYIPAFNPEAAIRMAVMGVESACYEFQPDVVLFISGFFITDWLVDIIHRNGTQIAVLHTESPYEDDKQLVRAEMVDVNVICDPTNLERFPKGTVFLPHAYRPEIHHPGVKAPTVEFSFVGTGYPSRVEFFEKVDFDGVNVRFEGNWQNLDTDSPLMEFVADDPAHCFDNDRTADLYRASMTSANLYRRESERPELSTGWAMGPREVELAACGTWFARDPRGEGDELFSTLPTFTTPDELGEQVRWALAHPTERREAAQVARSAVADRTFDNYCRSFLQLL